MSIEQHNPLLVIGLMSGTSVDGIDAALVKTDGTSLTCLQHASFEYKDATRDAVFSAYNNPEKFIQQEKALETLSQAIAEDHAAAVKCLIENTNEQVDLIGFHGQTLLHQPDIGYTLQLGDAALLARTTNIDTVFDFRRADIQAGGQGAPLAPIYHQALIQQAGLELPAAMLNIGGVANLSYWDGQQLIGFDTGPGNGLLDQYMRQHVNRPFDQNGQLASTGVVCQPIVNEFLANRYFAQLKPKSLDRSEFNAVLSNPVFLRLPAADAMATLVALTVQSVRCAMDLFEQPVKQLVVCGGGQHNAFLLSELKSSVASQVKTADQLGLAGDHIEAELMALLAARFYYRLPSTFPMTTGVEKPCVAGTLQLANEKT